MSSKTIFTICLLLLGAIAVQAQELKSFKADNDKYGYKDQNGKIIIEAKYDYAKIFTEGLAPVNIGGKLSAFSVNDYGSYVIGGKWGYIDKKGKEVISIKYSYASIFENGLAAVVHNGQWGFIDKNDKVVVPFEYDDVGDYFFDFNLYSRGFDKDGKIKVQKDGRQFYIDKTGKEIEDDNAVLQKMATAYQSGNFTEAFKLAEQLANKHNADAMNLLGNMHAQGQGTKQNYGMARSWWEMASGKGNAAATGNIGLLYAQGWGVPQNIAEAEKWFKKGADLGDPQSMFNLGNLAFQKGNLTEAKQWIQKAKTAGHPQADAALQQINAASANQQQPRRDKN